jgi:hypothetical protein
MFDTMLSRDMRQTLDHFRRRVDQLFDNFYGSGSRLATSNGSSQNGSEYGKFRASVPLTQKLNTDQVKYRLQDGVLDIHVPVAEDMKPRQIPIEFTKSHKAIAA